MPKPVSMIDTLPPEAQNQIIAWLEVESRPKVVERIATNDEDKINQARSIIFNRPIADLPPPRETPFIVNLSHTHSYEGTDHNQR